MMQSDAFKKQFASVLLYAVVSLFLIPLSALLFVKHAESARDALYLERALENINVRQSMPPAERTAAESFFRDNPPSTACDNSNVEIADYRASVCAPWSELWQYHVVEQVSWWTLMGGAIVLLAIFSLGAIAFRNRRGQYVSFVVGWNLLRITSATEVLVQGALLIWLSFWITAFFFHHYFIKLIIIAAILAGGAALNAIAGIFKRAPGSTGIEGELVIEKDAPTLWTHVRECAKRLQTTPPDHIVAGIDANFFVTEAPLTVDGQTVTGRSLYVSLPLLRILDRTEADAVLSHELAHFSGGDTASSAALGPKLVQYDHYCELMRRGGATIVVFYLMRLYRVIFEIALQRDSRAREFLADRVAARLVSPQAIAHSLVKIAAYARYRYEIEEQLFQQNSRHENSLGIAHQVFAGLAPYAASTHFIDAMATANVPHPFDSHPSMPERMRNVGHEIAAHDFGCIATSTPVTTWVSDIQIADNIERRLWSVYEQRFTDDHERSLAYRYRPDNDTERAIVAKYFPPVVFALRGGKRLQVTYEGLVLPKQTQILSWDRVANLKYTDGFGGDVLQIVHPEKGLLGPRTTKVKLPGVSGQRDQLKQMLGHYWQRHNGARQ